MKLTDPKYQLPVLQALEPLKEYGTGANKPMLMRCVDTTTGERSDIVVKLKDGERMTRGESHAFELMGSWLAREMNIRVPDPNLVEISPELHQALIGSEFYGRVQRSIGYNFGSENLENMQQPDQRDELRRSHIIDAQRIFLFDLMTVNPDRTPQKVNMLSDNEHIYAIDHELAFSSIPFMFPSRSNPWKMNAGDVNMVKSGIILTLIQGKRFDLDPFVSDIAGVTQEFWDKALSLIPAEWHWEHWPLVSEFITQIVENVEEFVENAKRTLL